MKLAWDAGGRERFEAAQEKRDRRAEKRSRVESRFDGFRMHAREKRRDKVRAAREASDFAVSRPRRREARLRSPRYTRNEKTGVIRRAR